MDSLVEPLITLASNRFISSISARVGALSRMRGRDDGRQTDRSMHDVDLTSQGHVSARQGSEPNAEKKYTHQKTGMNLPRTIKGTRKYSTSATQVGVQGQTLRRAPSPV